MTGKLSIFIVHSQSSNTAKEFLDYLRKNFLGFDFLSLGSELTLGEPVPIELERVASIGDAAIILATPDDFGKGATESEYNSRARQNIWLETGWFWAKIGRSRSLIINQKDIEMPSDTHGIFTSQYKLSPLEVMNEVEVFLNELRNNKTNEAPEVIFGSIATDSRINQFQNVVNKSTSSLHISGIGMTAMRHTFRQILAIKIDENPDFHCEFLLLDGEFSRNSRKYTSNIYRESLSSDVDTFSSEVLSLINSRPIMKKHVSMRAYSGIMPFVMTASDPDELGGYMMVEVISPLGDLYHPLERPRFLIKRRVNFGLFHKFWQSFQDMWNASRVII